jgi:hypothetical protein
MRVSRLLSCLLAASLCAPAPAPAAPSSAACQERAFEDVVASVSAEGEFRLASQGAIKLADVRLPFDDEAFGRVRAWLQSLAGRPVAVVALAGAADRWNRMAGRIALLDEASPVDVAELLVDEGFAVVDVSERQGLCRPDLLGREERARARGLGLWANERHKPVPAEDLARLQALAGRFALVEGVVRSVGERRERTYLNFGPDWATDMTVSIPKRTWGMLAERGLTAAACAPAACSASGKVSPWRSPRPTC